MSSQVATSGSAAARQATLVVNDVSHAYGRVMVVRELGLSVDAGEVHCLLGPSGSGKSTLLRLVAGLERLQVARRSSSTITIDGETVAGRGIHRRPEARSVGFVFQDYALFPHLDVLRNVLFGMPAGRRAERRAAAEALVAQVGMAAHLHAMPHTLSGGQQQRVALARALARRPRVMLLDEPFSGLDARLREEVRQTTLDVLRTAGVATLMVTHDPGEALVSGDLVSVIGEGRIAQTGAPTEVYARSSDRRVAEVFGPVNALPATVRDGRVESPWGTLDAANFADGQGVEILIRPEAFELSAADAGVEGRIAHRLDEGALAHLRITLRDGREILARDLARQGWQEGQDVRVGLDPAAAWVCGTPLRE